MRSVDSAPEAQKLARTTSEIVFRLKGRKPHQIPLARMAAYMQEFATLIGAADAVLFSEIRDGSTCIAANPKGGGALSSIRRRVVDASLGKGPREACAAFDHLTDMANADRSPAKVTDGPSTIVFFPTNRPVYEPLRLHERGHITGVLEGVLRDGSKGIKARIRPDGGSMIICTATSAVGKSIGGMFLDTVRAHGSGAWRRDESGKWACEKFSIESISRVSTASLRSAVDEIRSIEMTWEDDPWADFDEAAGTA